MNSFPPTTVGEPNAVVTPGKPKDHFSFNFAVVAGVSPARRAGWKRVFAASAQPVHSPDRCCAGVEHFEDAGMATAAAVPRYLATASRSVAVNASPTPFILPLSSAVRIACQDICRSVCGKGALTALLALWHCAHRD